MAVPPKNSTVGVVTVPHDESGCRTAEKFHAVGSGCLHGFRNPVSVRLSRMGIMTDLVCALEWRGGGLRASGVDGYLISKIPCVGH